MIPAPVVLVYIYAHPDTISLLPQDIWIMGDTSYPYRVPPIPLLTLTTSKKKGLQFTTDHSCRRLLLDPSPLNGPLSLIQFPPEMVENWWRYGGEVVMK